MAWVCFIGDGAVLTVCVYRASVQGRQALWSYIRAEGHLALLWHSSIHELLGISTILVGTRPELVMLGVVKRRNAGNSTLYALMGLACVCSGSFLQ